MLTRHATRATRSGGRRRVAGLVTVLALTLVTTALPGAAPAAADPPGAVCPPGQTNCDVWGDEPGGPGNGGDNGGNNGGNNGGGNRTCTRGDEVVPCYDPALGWFNQSDGCYYKVSDPQPDGVPEGMTAYTRTCLGAAPQNVFLPEPPPGFDPPDPATLAARALASINRKRPTVHMAPDPDNGPGLVGLPVWLWTDPAAAPSRDNPIRASASERGVTVTISAYVEEIVWNMGNGDTVTCTGPGTPYSGGGGKSPTCGYDGYPKSSGDGRYTITATANWVVPWSGGGMSDTIRNTLTASDEIEIDELQVVTE